MNKKLLNRKVLVTAGPTWVPIDKVRVITNIFGGALGSIIADESRKSGAKVTLLFGPGKASLPKESKNLKILKYKYYDELSKLVSRELKNGNYDVIIHSAAVADYAPVLSEKGKIKSGKKSLTIKLTSTKKIVDSIKKIKPDIFLVKFKLEVGLSKDKLINVAFQSMKKSNADLIVANEYSDVIKAHRAFIIDKDKKVIEVLGKRLIALKLINEISKNVRLSYV